MIVFEDCNRTGYDAAEQAFNTLVSTIPPATPIERASVLYGMQTFCRRQLKQELASALELLDGAVATLGEPS